MQTRWQHITMNVQQKSYFSIVIMTESDLVIFVAEHPYLGRALLEKLYKKLCLPLADYCD